MLINGKTPEEIERDIERCAEEQSCGGCPYVNKMHCVEEIMTNAHILIDHLNARIAKQNALLAVMGVTIPEEKEENV